MSRAQSLGNRIFRIRPSATILRFSFAVLALLLGIEGWAEAGQASGQSQAPGVPATAGSSMPFNSNAGSGTGLQDTGAGESLIPFLLHHPEMLAIARIQVAQAMGVDPTTISLQQVFGRLQQDPGLQLKLTQMFEKRGYRITPDLNQLQAYPGNALGTTAQQPGLPANVQVNAILVQGTACPAGYLPLGTYSSSAANSVQPPLAPQTRSSSLGGNSGLDAASVLSAPGSQAAKSGGLQGSPGVTGSSGQSSALNSQSAQASLAGVNPAAAQGLQGGLNGQGANLTGAGASVSGVQPQSGIASGTMICVPSQYLANQPATRQRPLPYEYMQSLVDLYTQVLPPDNTALKRFGSDVFNVGSGNVDQLPMDLPAGPDYVLGVGDELNINLWGSQAESLIVTVDRQGLVALPESGSVEVSGLTIAAAQRAIQNGLHTQFRDVHVEISLGRVHTVRVYLVGDVQRPGAYDIGSLSTPLNALYQAGGPTATGSLRILKHFRGQKLVSEIDLYDLLLHGVHAPVERLLPGDTLMIPPVGAQVAVNGLVRRPAIYELKGGESLADVLAMAGGVLVDASLAKLNVERVEAHQRRTMVSVEVPAQAASGKTALDAPQLTGFPVQDGDSVLVQSIVPYNESAVFLDGHVYRPGKYPYREGMTIGDLLRSSQDIMPEPADRIELIRLAGADYHPETTLLNLQDVLHGNSPVPLKPFDFLRVFSRYENDSPTVTITGEVIRPGDYPMSAGMKASDLVRMAGGFRRSAYREEADLASYTIEDGKAVLLDTRAVPIERALNGDRSADAELKPGSILSIKQIGGWQDIGSTVALSGEVAHPGTYSILPGERLSSVLKRAGGFREDAFARGIVLQRDSARILAEQARQEMIQRLQTLDIGTEAMNAASSGSESQADVLQAMRTQQQQAVAALRGAPASGRVVVQIGNDISRWENTPADIRLSANDTILIPKLNEIVNVFGQVYDQTSLAYVRGRDVRWYLRQAGGTTRSADRGAVYVIHADGSHISRMGGLAGSGVMSARLMPGDTIIVPEKIVGTPLWKNVVSMAQAMMVPAMLGVAATR